MLDFDKQSERQSSGLKYKSRNVHDKLGFMSKKYKDKELKYKRFIKTIPLKYGELL